MIRTILMLAAGGALCLSVQIAGADSAPPDLWDQSWVAAHSGYTKSKFCADAAQSSACLNNSQECMDAYMKAYVQNSWTCAGVVYPSSEAERAALKARLQKKYSNEVPSSGTAPMQSVVETKNLDRAADPPDVWDPNWKRPSSSYGAKEFCADAAGSLACSEHSEICDDDYNKAFLSYFWSCPGLKYPNNLQTEGQRLRDKYKDDHGDQQIRQMAEQGDADAQEKLGTMYARGFVIAQDHREAMNWYRKAADRGNLEAQADIGRLYRDGSGVPQDYRKALEWYRKAAERGNVQGELGLFKLYDQGWGVPKDGKQSVFWLTKAAESGDVFSQMTLGDLYVNGRPDVPQSYRDAIRWHRAAADKGLTYAQFSLGQIYRTGSPDIRDYGQALDWYRKAAEGGHVQAVYFVGVFYENGWGVSQDYSQAMAWYHKAADQGNAQAQWAIGWLYDNGQGVPQDYGQALAWYRKAADQGNPTAQNFVGILYRSGKGMPKDYVQAMTWFRKAADQGDAGAQFNVANLYETGQGVPSDFTIARFWYQKAADQGSTAAKDALAKLGATKPAEMTKADFYDRNIQAIVAKQQASAPADQSQQQTQAATDRDAKRQQIADLQSKISDLKDDAETNEQAAANFDQQSQVLQGPGAIMARTFATQKRQEVQRINRQISELQDQLQSVQSQPEPRYSTDNNPSVPPNSTPAIRASAPAGATAAAGGASGSAVVGGAASGCWSSELDAINDPIVRARLGNNRVQQVIQIAQGGGAAALDQQIALMQQQEQQAENGIRDANQAIAATAPGGPEEGVTPRECSDMNQHVAGAPVSAHAAAMCQRLAMKNELHLASGLIEVMQCVRASTR